MSGNKPTGAISPARIARKFLVSGFVVFTFIAYAIHEHFVNPDASARVLATQGSPSGQQLTQSSEPIISATPQTDLSSSRTLPPPTSATAPTDAAPILPSPTPVPTSAPSPTSRPQGQYKDGSYTGPEVDAFWGLVQIKAVIRNGKIADVTFLEYPSDRRTSQRINNVAMPYLKTEALQVQSANVDIISGATLTSEGFAESLQAALDSAKN